MEFKHFDQIRSLIREAIEHLNNMGRQDGKQLVPVFVDARKLLETAYPSRNAKILLLSAANQRITSAEKSAKSWNRIGQRGNTSDVFHIVRFRQICEEISNLLDDEMDHSRLR